MSSLGEIPVLTVFKVTDKSTQPKASNTNINVSKNFMASTPPRVKGRTGAISILFHLNGHDMDDTDPGT